MLAIAAIAACEGRSVTVMGIDGAFLIADITSTCIKAHMRLGRMVTDMLFQIDPEYARFVEERGTFVVVLDKALYGCVEAAALWHANLCATMRGDKFDPNPYDPCVVNKQRPDGAQITVLMHVDDLLITSTGNVGDNITVRAFINASYGVHQSSGEISHRLRHCARRGRGVVCPLLQAKDCYQVKHGD